MKKNQDLLLAFSGGIDSCAAVELLRKDGYNVQAMTINMMGDEHMLQQARLSAERLDVPLTIVDGRDIFEKEIIENFKNEYLGGRTPAPCTRCNTLIKWELLANEADRLGIYYIASGHYFRISEVDDYKYVTRGKDPQKDQSYYLWGVRQEILKRIITPMAEQIKADVKSRSEIKRESMGICFLKGRSYSEFLIENGCKLPEGDVVTQNGAIVGTHNGIARYTIGQKRGEGIPSGLRVIGIKADENEIVVGENSLLFQKTLIINNCYFTNIEEVTSSEKVEIMVRGLGLNPEGYAKVEWLDQEKNIIKITLSNPAWAAAKGQPVVLYIDERVVGGGYLEEAI